MARPKKTLTPRQTKEVQSLAAVLNVEQIASYFGMSRDAFNSLKNRDSKVLSAYKKGKAKAIYDVGSGLLTKAREGNLVAMMFYLKTQAGWRENSEGPLDEDDEPPKLSYTFNVAPAVGDIKITNAKP